MQLEPKNQPDPRDEGCELIDSLSISDGLNCFEMRLTKRANRLSRINLYLNGEEVRGAAYAGRNAGQSYFKLLKNSLKKE